MNNATFSVSHPWLSRKVKIKFWRLLELLRIREFAFQVHDPDITLRVNLKDDSVAKPIYLGDFEKETVLFTTKFVKPGDVVFDIGANIGYFTLLFAHLVGNAGLVHSFEPSRREFDHLCKNISINRCKNVFLNHMAVGDQNGYATLNVLDDDQFGAYNSIVDITHQKVSNEPAHIETTRIINIDTYIDLINHASPSLIKLDVEGFEKQVLEGMKTLLSASDAPCLILEVCEDTHTNTKYGVQELLDHLSIINFELFSPDKEGNLTPFVLGKSLNCIALKQNHFQRLTERDILFAAR